MISKITAGNLKIRIKSLSGMSLLEIFALYYPVKQVFISAFLIVRHNHNLRMEDLKLCKSKTSSLFLLDD